MLLDAIATVILAGLMLIPFLNVIVGAVIGAGLAGPPGAFAGILTGVAIVSLETFIADRLGWRDLRCVSPDVAERLVDERVAGGGRSITAGRPARRAMPRRVRGMKQTPRPARAGNMRTA
jgi:hypothetical protein